MSARTMIPELDLAGIRYFDACVPRRAAHQVRLEVEVDGSAATIVECRAPWRADFRPEWTRFPIARLRYSPANAGWTFWRDGNLRWRRYDRIDTSARIGPLLAEIDADPTAIFWG